MEISRLDENTILLARIDPFLADFLRRIPSNADPGDDAAAKARIFSAPTNDKKEKHFVADWQELIEPELAQLFQSAIEVVAGDLKKLHPEPKTGECSLPIAKDHLESWIHGLNQARLVLTERHQIGEAELERVPAGASSPRSRLLMQMHFYAELQFLFLKLLDGA